MNPQSPEITAVWAEQASHRGTARLDATLLADGVGTTLRDATLVVERVGPPSTPVGAVPLAGAWRVAAALPTFEAERHSRYLSLPTLRLPAHALLPGFVNAHTHLDLTHIGPREFETRRGFVGWVEMIRHGRATDAPAIEASVEAGVRLSLAGGTVTVGDIAGAVAGRASCIAAEALARSPLEGVSFIEFFAIGRSQEPGLAAMRSTLERSETNAPAHRVGLQPHAPNTVSLAGYLAAIEAAAGRGLRLSTHLAETREEYEFISRASGPQRELLENLGIWDDAMVTGPAAIGLGRSPTRHLEPALRRATFLLAHANLLDESDIALLSETRQSVAYCPRAHTYFGHEPAIGPHPYRRLLAASVNVALGTDSLVNLPPEAARETHGISVLDEMRLLYARDKFDPATLLKMATVNGAAALGLNPTNFTFSPQAELAGIVAVEIDRVPSPSLADVLKSTSRPRLLLLRGG